MYVQCCVSAQLRLPPLAFLFILWAAFDSVEGGRKFVEFGGRLGVGCLIPEARQLVILGAQMLQMLRM